MSIELKNKISIGCLTKDKVIQELNKEISMISHNKIITLEDNKITNKKIKEIEDKIST